MYPNDDFNDYLNDGNNVIDISKYLDSEVREKYGLINSNKWYEDLSKQDFENKVFVPLVKYAKKIHIIDKYIIDGRDELEEEKHKNPSEPYNHHDRGQRDMVLAQEVWYSLEIYSLRPLVCRYRYSAKCHPLPLLG